MQPAQFVSMLFVLPVIIFITFLYFYDNIRASKNRKKSKREKKKVVKTRKGVGSKNCKRVKNTPYIITLGEIWERIAYHLLFS